MDYYRLFRIIMYVMEVRFYYNVFDLKKENDWNTWNDRDF
jgi:hypothetical protein